MKGRGTKFPLYIRIEKMNKKRYGAILRLFAKMVHGLNDFSGMDEMDTLYSVPQVVECEVFNYEV